MALTEQEEQVVAGIIYNHNSGMQLIYNDQSNSAIELAQKIQAYIANDYDLLSIGNYNIILDGIYGVLNFDTNQVEVINLDNKPTNMLDFAKVAEMSDEQLDDAMSTAIDIIAQIDTEDDEYLDMWLNSIDDVFKQLQMRYIKQKAYGQLLEGFIAKHNLDKQLQQILNSR